MTDRRWTIYVCPEGYVNGPLWDAGCESCYHSTEPVEVVPALPGEERDVLLDLVEWRLAEPLLEDGRRAALESVRERLL